MQLKFMYNKHELKLHISFWDAETIAPSRSGVSMQELIQELFNDHPAIEHYLYQSLEDRPDYLACKSHYQTVEKEFLSTLTEAQYRQFLDYEAAVNHCHALALEVFYHAGLSLRQAVLSAFYP